MYKTWYSRHWEYNVVHKGEGSYDQDWCTSQHVTEYLNKVHNLQALLKMKVPTYIRHSNIKFANGRPGLTPAYENMGKVLEY